MLFPNENQEHDSITCLALQDVHKGDGLPVAYGVFDVGDPAQLGEPYALTDFGKDTEPGVRSVRLLGEQSEGSFARPNLRGQRIGAEGDSVQTGRAWSPRFVMTGTPKVSQSGDGTNDRRQLVLEAEDGDAGLRLVTRVEAMAGGALRIRHELTNIASGVYSLEGLEVRVPLRDNQTEFLDFTGRHERERTPQRHRVHDGTWLRECRHGRPGFESGAIVAGTPGFGFGKGSVTAVQLAFSGNAVLAVDRSDEDEAAMCVGELLNSGEVALAQGETYEMPWVVVAASNNGLDGLAHRIHRWERSLPTHPKRQPVTLNVWEAVYFDHDFSVLSDIADRAAELGVERYVLDDGWFHLRRTDNAGLGDWWVDETVWPGGLGRIVDLVHSKGMEFGLWFEPEMVNPDSDLFRKHPDWMLQAKGRRPLEQRRQFVVDLTNREAFDYILDSVSAVLSQYAVDAVKWDHNRSLLEAGSNVRGGAPAVHRQTLAYYRLLDTLRQRFPKVQWESCASGGGRVDLGVAEHVSRFWTSDMTDALSRQQIQRWTVQMLAPELMGAHVSAPTSHQTGRSFTTNFRAASAAFYSFGIEWNILKASESDLDELRQWIDWYKGHRGFLHSGDYIRLDTAEPAALAYGVRAGDGSRAIVEYVQMDESASNRGTWLRIPGLKPDAHYALTWTGPKPHDEQESEADKGHLSEVGPTAGAELTGLYLERQGIRIPRRRPETALIIDIIEC